MEYSNETARAELCAAAGIVDSGAIETFFVFRSVILLLIAAAIALVVGISLAKVCMECCFTQGVAYADPIEHVSSTEKLAPTLLAETLKSMDSSAAT